ncbi:hypothetical protein LOTGIDRAFT_158257 [Lottia gigantea]|uniref:Uncharacterized protein n=1 Tax=Lottia gigantea TaxID=225164 RepID=V4CDM4_LOTGI|nr:hypothetical protein LOTGIDRAFT_158257 [Lottia gigantea]ESP00030.1 hypothetical protein LOTGIDRAFT_158257 [Lottia gigantea]
MDTIHFIRRSIVLVMIGSHGQASLLLFFSIIQGYITKAYPVLGCYVNRIPIKSTDQGHKVRSAVQFSKTSGSKVKEKTGYRPPMESSKLKIKRRFEDLGQSKTSNAKCLKVKNGLFINYLTSSGENIVHLLAQCYIDYYIDFSFLFDYKLDFNHTNNDGNSPLMVASLFMNSPFLQFLAPLPCDVNRQNHQGHTALHLCVTGFTLIKEKLNMMKVNSIVKELCAFEYFPRYLQCIGILLSLGADVNMQDKKGKTVLMLACMKNDRKLLETLFIHGADVNIVDNHRRSALQYIDLTNNVYDLTCFNLLLSRGCRQSFNQPCLNGNTLIQNLLQFSPLWQIDQTVNFIKFLVFNNVNLQHLTSDDGEISYGQLSLEEFSSQSRHELRQILVLSGGSVVQITKILHFEQEENYEASLPETLREKPREKFCLFANNLSLKEICRRVIRQNTGLAIHDRFSELLDFPTLTDFLMFKDIDSMRFSLPVQLMSVIDDDYDDDYNSYDLNKENDDYENDYLMYKGLKYLNEVPSYSDSYLDSV